MPGLRGVGVLRQCGVCGAHREGEGWRVKRGRRVEWRRSALPGAVPVCGVCLVRAVVAMLRSGRAGFERGRGGIWFRRLGRRPVVVRESMGPRCWRRALALGVATGVPALSHLRCLVGR